MIELSRFNSVDQTDDPDSFIRFLDEASADESFHAYKRHSFSLLDLQAGQRVLDVGCGTGDDVRALAEFLAPGGRCVGVDGSHTMIAAANKRAEGCGQPIAFHVGDAHRLPFANDTFDACRCDRAFMHLRDPKRALDEMVRVTRPGGRVLVYEVDFETLTLDLPDHARTRTVIQTWCDQFADGWLGRRIPSLFRAANLREVRITPATLWLRYPVVMQLLGPATLERARLAGSLTPAEGEDWLRQLHERHESGTLFSTLTGFLVVGRKP